MHFNLLYDHGANPTVSYVRNDRVIVADSREKLVGEIVSQLRRPNDGGGAEDRLDAALPPIFGRNISKTEDGRWRYADTSMIAVLGWDPNDVSY